MGKRGRFEFPDRVRQLAIKKWHAENPGREGENLEVDHIIPVWYAKKNGIPQDYLRTRDNARALPVKEHRKRHRNEPTEDEYKTLSQGILGIIGRLF